MKWVYLLVAIVGEVVGTSALKASEGFTKLGPSLLAVGGFATALFFLALTLRVIPVGIAYAIWSGVGIVLISLIGYFVYAQKLDTPALVGMGLIMAGVLVINLMSRSVGS